MRFVAVAALLVSTLLAVGAGQVRASSGSTVTLDVPWIPQTHTLSCEEAAMAMLLAYQGLNVSQDQILQYIGADLRQPYWDYSGLLHWGDGYQTFVGNVNGSMVNYTGLGALMTPVANAAAHFGGDVLQSGEGFGAATVYGEVAQGNPVAAWVTYDWQPRQRHDYLAFDGRWQPFIPGDIHVVDVVGVSDTQVLVNDPDGNGLAANHPYPGRYWIDKSTFAAGFAAMGGMAIVMDAPTRAPAIVQAWASAQSASLDWTTAILDDGPATGYLVQGNPGGLQWTFAAQNHAVLTGLTDGTTYTFTVRASNANGVTTPWSAASAAMTPPGQTAGPQSVYTAVTPTRICDTRPASPANQCTGHALAPQGTWDVQVTGSFGAATVPASATSVVINLTAVNGSAGSFVTAYPAGGGRPNSSNLNFPPHANVPNLVTVRVGSGGKVTIYNDQGAVDMIADLAGYYAPAAGPTATTGFGHFVPVPPTRLLDSRLDGSNPLWPSHGPLGEGQTRQVQVYGYPGGNPVPAGATAVVLNATVEGPSRGSYLTVSPDGSYSGLPPSSNLNYGPGQTIANRVIVPIPADGKIDLYNSLGTTSVILDVNGWFLSPNDPATAGNYFVALPPLRVMDTRPSDQVGPVTSPVGQSPLTVQLAGQGMIPALGGAGSPTAVVMNVTAVAPTNGSYIEVYPAEPRPTASDLNFAPGENLPNQTIVQLSPSGTVQVFNSIGSADVIFDVAGYFTRAD